MVISIALLFENFFSFIDVLIFLYFFSIFAESKRKVKIWYTFFLLLVSIIVNQLAFTENVFKELLFICEFLFAGLLYYKTKFVPLCLLTTIYYIGIGIISLTTISIAVSLFGSTVELIMSNTLDRILVVMTAKCLIIILIAFLDRLKKPSLYTSNRRFIIALVINLTILVIGLDFINRKFILKSNQGKSVVLFLLLVIFSSVMLVVYTINEVSKTEQKRYNYELMAITNQMNKEIVENVHSQMQEIKKIRHNENNSYIALELLLEKNKVDEAISFVRQKISSIEKIPSYISTGNYILDALLNYAKIKYPELIFDLNINIIESFGIDGSDFCVLFGNALDNACESAFKCMKRGEDGYVKIELKSEHETLLLSILNSTSEIQDINNLKTMKKDKVNHGLGLKSIEQVVDKYNGIKEYKYEKQTFCINIVLKNK
ncbi:GHKL domain-containing protein [Holdemania filiformis]|uniref:Sensor histidine kinase NatK-like C-terminal domain-containing protein n=1 Tax=Holdemania filiformis DSM 12042 TaxID=545696 RepID=B9Y8U1_9FIRM|nr:GHKL domain-containing protein [Holdemania filiformis]EEF67610.1 hypothetical protein HOLDEFILI_02241 [Holdemania filiformis DSM 12042]MCQ4952679.1 GHKL domain-containing protein [Holdemania filiformis]